MYEETVVVVMPLPAGVNAVFCEDSNIVCLSDQLDEDGRDQALAELQAQWRRNALRSIRGGLSTGTRTG